MKSVDKKKPISTMPDGIWESALPVKNHKTAASQTTDLQGNGYPPASSAMSDKAAGKKH